MLQMSRLEASCRAKYRVRLCEVVDTAVGGESGQQLTTLLRSRLS